jgi:uncharacterized glyoxalase superfamily metalloenzyme YdcJ
METVTQRQGCNPVAAIADVVAIGGEHRTTNTNQTITIDHHMHLTFSRKTLSVDHVTPPPAEYRPVVEQTSPVRP